MALKHAQIDENTILLDIGSGIGKKQRNFDEFDQFHENSSPSHIHFFDQDSERKAQVFVFFFEVPVEQFDS